ncbi:MAG: transglutaminase family protein, partial [Prosthecobacter sp.]|nr:transglutaminase family protein [Prosthecobacter sp.]
LFEQGLDKAVGYALPLRRLPDGEGLRWRSGPWYFRNDTMYLIPGDSAMGLRLPLDSLPWVNPKEYPWIHPVDPTTALPALPPRPESRQHFLKAVAGMLEDLPPNINTAVDAAGELMEQVAEPAPEPKSPDERRPEPQESAAWILRTATCFEARAGRLHVFMPPMAETEDYLDLLAAVESTAAALAMPVIIEGAAPAFDPRLEVIKVTPDPGVIEVNMHPAKCWKDLVRNTKVLYEEARQARLGTEKFMIDGRHTGTGGGNHIVIGGATPADSPLLRRPDLLKSLLGYWHNHPSLSYLFSGLFIGPTSQCPRIDEARNDSVFELELAFKELDRNLALPTSAPPWMVDRIFRNLLIDSSGNTHRTEFSIDKLFDPLSSTGRLGLLELRSFEMPPHAEMSLAQHLLLRAAIARFWKEPYRQKLVRWGTELHDRFLLPHFVWEDLADVLADLTAAGYPMQPEWFAPHFEFRFPAIGSMTQRGVYMELRTALEPWHVLGEEGAGAAAVRYVDSSLERVQVRTKGLVAGRYVVTCNGRQIPLHPTGVVGEHVAGVRYRAWQPPNCLQPTIKVHSPLTFDLVDTWNGRSLGGCAYHVVHPGGRNYVTFPVNAYEAESRRLGRFFADVHTPGPMEPVLTKGVAEFPLTLDLRQG